jgi:hypothetical protein
MKVNPPRESKLMKEPRDILLARHQAAEPKLDALRHGVVENLPAKESPRVERLNSFTSACRELFRLPRWAWSGLAAAWLFIVGLNIAARETPATQVSSSTVAKNSSDSLQALREQKQLFAELVGPRPERSDADVPRFVPRPRSERTGVTACV